MENPNAVRTIKIANEVRMDYVLCVLRDKLPEVKITEHPTAVVGGSSEYEVRWHGIHLHLFISPASPTGLRGQAIVCGHGVIFTPNPDTFSNFVDDFWACEESIYTWLKGCTEYPAGTACPFELTDSFTTCSGDCEKCGLQTTEWILELVD